MTICLQNNNQQPTTNNQQPTTNNQQPTTTNNQQPKQTGKIMSAWNSSKTLAQRLAEKLKTEQQQETKSAQTQTKPQPSYVHLEPPLIDSDHWYQRHHLDGSTTHPLVARISGQNDDATETKQLDSSEQQPTMLIVAVIVFSDDNKDKILLTRDEVEAGWYIPAGAVNQSETIPQAAARIVKQESGLIVK